MEPWATRDFANASSQHVPGFRAEAAVEDARERLARAIGAAEPREIVFTSGTTEADNLALKGVARAGRRRRDHLVTVATEHPAVLDPCRALEREGFSVTVLPVDAGGRVDPRAVAAAITERTALVSVMAANSEVGTLQPLAEIGRICREREVPLHTDAAQAVGRIPVDVEAWGVDLLSFCAHKLYGPKGIGALWVRRRRPRIRIEPLLHGGGHERGLRGGTENTAAIVGFGKAAALATEELDDRIEHMRGLRDRLIEGLTTIDGVTIFGDGADRLPNTVQFALPGYDGEGLLMVLDQRGAAVSSGSACASGKGEPSHVLLAMGVPHEVAQGAIRVSLGKDNTAEEVDEFLQVLRDLACGAAMPSLNPAVLAG